MPKFAIVKNVEEKENLKENISEMVEEYPTTDITSQRRKRIELKSIKALRFPLFLLCLKGNE
jgi:hypothetical protein